MNCAANAPECDWTAYGSERLLSRNRLLDVHHQAFFRFFLNFFSTIEVGLSVLDVGCGDGFWMEVLRNLGFERVEEIDMSAPSLERAAHKNLAVRQMDVLAMARTEKFDVVMMCDVLEHVPDASLALRQVADVLNDSGLLFLSVPVCDSLRDRWRRMTRGTTRLQQMQAWDPTHCHAWSERDLAALLDANGFDVTLRRHLYNPFPLVGLFGRHVDRLFHGLTWGGRMGRTLCMAARKRPAGLAHTGCPR